MKNKQYLCERVIEEATALKQLATKEEINKLSLLTLSPLDPSNCIYGQMTGSCDSERAMNLFHECAVYGISTALYLIDSLPRFEDIKFSYKKYYRSPIDEKYLYVKGAYSPIEVFLVHCNNQDRSILIDFIQDRIKDGELNHYDFQFFHD